MRGLPALLLLALLLTAGSAAAAGELLTVCADPEPPPWNYWKRDRDGNPTQELVGFSVDLVRRVFSRLGHEVKFVTGVPWPRCMRDVAKKRVDFAMDIYEDDNQGKEYLRSERYDTLTPQLFTLRDHPIEVHSLGDLKRYRGCGIYDADYAHYGLNERDLDLSANGYVGVIQKLKGRHCDYFVEELEILAGYRLSHEDYLSDPDIVHRPLPGAKRPSLHLVTALDGEGAKLMPRINEMIDSMDKSGELIALWRQYAGEIPYSR